VDVPEEYDGLGLDKTTSALVADHISVNASFSTAFGAHAGIGTLPLIWYGSEAQKQRYLPRLASAEWIAAYALSEATSGSDAMNIRTRATLSPDGSEYILNGEKMWITNGGFADLYTVFAKIDGEKFSAFLVERGTAGFTAGKEEHKLGIRGSSTCALVFSDCRIPAGNLLGEGAESVRGFLVETNRPGFSAHDIHGKWSLRASVTSGLTLEGVHVPAANLLPGATSLKSALMCLNQARYGISWGAIGAAMDCYSTALNYSKTRKQFHNQPIAGHQLVQEKLVWMASEISKAQLLSLHVGRLKDAGKAGHQHISMAKRNNVWMALECARLARDILGANGITEDFPVMRHSMNLESVKTYEGTHDIHTLILGQHLTGIGAY
jgi:glutaryl-CoA dehydrogenase